MSQILFGTAGALATVWFVVHVFVGGKEIARPLLQADSLDALVRHTQYLCWHFTTVAIAAIAGFFLIATLQGALAFATAATILASGFFVVGVGLVVAMGESHLRLPQGWLFLPVAALGLWGHLV